MILWDEEYREGKWNFLSDDLEADRFKYIAELLKNRPGNVLDLGCGEGWILKYLQEQDFTYYKGVDISFTALMKTIAFKNTSFVVCDINNYYDDGTYDYIILSEVLYYLKYPLLVLYNLTKKLSNHGIIILSLFIDEWNMELLEKIMKYMNVFSFSKIENSRGVWGILVIKN